MDGLVGRNERTGRQNTHGRVTTAGQPPRAELTLSLSLNVAGLCVCVCDGAAGHAPAREGQARRHVQPSAQDAVRAPNHDSLLDVLRASLSRASFWNRAGSLSLSCRLLFPYRWLVERRPLLLTRRCRRVTAASGLFCCIASGSLTDRVGVTNAQGCG